MQLNAYWPFAATRKKPALKGLTKTSLPVRQALLIMNFTAIILLTACLTASAGGYSQNITLNVKDVPLENVFQEIKKQSGYSFVYAKDLTTKSKKVTLQLNNATIEEALKKCFAGQPFTYKIINTVVIINTKDEAVVRNQLEAISETGPPIDVKGRVVNEKGEPVAGANVQVKGDKNKVTNTDVNGFFELKNVDENAVLKISAVNIETFEVKISGRTNLSILSAKMKVESLEDVTVEVNTGYQKLPKERSTGSFEFIDKEKINRQVGIDILSRLEGVSNVVLFDRRELSASARGISPTKILIRGLSTLTEIPEGVKAPLIIVNNFPYDGDINNLNPNDVENITILKDAAAASIWGARAANGVIVITTKQGVNNQATKLSLNSNLQITQKPDLFHFPNMTSADFIEVETFLFNKGFYNSTINNVRSPGISPALEVLLKRRSGLITANDSASEINALKSLDVRNDFDKYIYQPSLNQQYFLNIDGGNEKIKYSFSGGFDKNFASIKGDNSQRTTFRSNTTIIPNSIIDFTLGVAFSASKSERNSLGEIGSSNYNYSGKSLYPYAQFTNTFAKDYREGYTDTAGTGKLLDWKYRFLDELNNANNTTRQNELVLNLGSTLKITRSLNASLQYQFQHATGENKNYFTEERYYTRNLINLYTQNDGNNITYIIPRGGILDYISLKNNSHRGRAQINFANQWKDKHSINALIGSEISEVIAEGSANRTYGYNEKTLSGINVDYTNFYPLYGERGFDLIPSGPNPFSKTTDHFVALFANAAYSYNNRYTISSSLRRDAANLFGVNTNNKWKPFWSVGVGWNVSDESFFKTKSISLLRFRANYGYQGNVNNSLSSYTILSYSPASQSIFNLPFASINSPRNPDLTWETIKQINFAIDFQILKKRVSGSIEFYKKRSNDLILESELDLTTGIGVVKRNSADMIGKGWEFSLSTLNVNSLFKWRTDFGLAHVKNEVKDYQLDDRFIRASSIVSSNGSTIRVQRGRSPYSLYSYQFAGLDTATGDPLGYLGKTTSKDYIAISNQLADTAGLTYHGSTIPTVFGNLNNIFSYKGISLTINISYRLGYYFRKNTISYFALYRTGRAHRDFSDRWQEPGDENITNVPSMIYPLSNPRRDDFYAFSSANVFKGDNIRLQYINLSYALKKTAAKWLPVSGIVFYVNVDNIGTLWKANKAGLDPDFNTGNSSYLPPRRYAFGLKVDF